MKIRKLISLLAATAMTVTALTGAMSVSVVSAADDYLTSGTCGKEASWIINSDGALIISGKGEMTQTEDGTSVKVWGWEKLKSCITEIIVENGVSVAGYLAFNCDGFNNFSATTKIILPPSLTSLNGFLNTNALLYRNLDDIYVYSKNVTDASTIYNSYYDGTSCTWHGSGKIWHVYKGSETENSLRNDLKLTDEDIEYLEDNAEMPTVENKTPAELEPLTEASGPAGLSSKYEWNETSKTLTFSGKGAISIADYYKNYAEETEHIVIKSGITVINSNTGIGDNSNTCGSFTGFTALKDVQLPDGITEIPVCAFRNDANLEEINFPDSLNVIGEVAFRGTKLKSINLREGMTIGGGAFNGCESLKEVTIPKNIKLENMFETGGAGMQRPSVTFANCTGLEKIIIEDGSWLGDAWNNEITPNGIPDCFCLGCTSLKTVIIKGNVEHIGEWAFNSSSLTDIYLYNTGLTTITAKGSARYEFSNPTLPIDWRDSFWTGNNPTFHVVKGSTTEQTLIDAGYLNDENTVYIADTTALETAIAEAEAIETDKYTDESVAEFTKAIENAKAILEDLTSTQDEVDSAVKAIEDAKKALEEKKEPSSDSSSNPSDSSSNPSDSSNPADSSNNPSDSSNPSGSGQSQPSNSGSSQPTSAQPVTNAPTTASPKVTPPTATKVVKPAKVKAVKLKQKKKKLNVSWKKVSGATGYEVKAATNSKFTKGKKTVTVKKNKATIKNLKPKKKYFVKVRAYKLANGRKYYGKWSKVVKKKTK